LGLPPVSLNDIHEIKAQVEGARAGLEHVLAQVRTLLQGRDLVGVWDDEAGSFIEEFMPVADRYHALERALCELSGEQFSWTHDLSTWVEAQK